MDETTRTLKLEFNGRTILASPLTDGQALVLSSMHTDTIGQGEISDLLDVLKAAVGAHQWRGIKADLVSGAADAKSVMELIGHIASAPAAKAADSEDEEFAAAEARFKELLAQRESNG